jgi:hypothetical protein
MVSAESYAELIPGRIGTDRLFTDGCQCEVRSETRSPLFSSVLLRSESAASCNIENLNALARAIAEQVMAG